MPVPMRPRGARLISRRLELTNERAGTRAVRSSIATLRDREVAGDEAPPNETGAEVEACQRRRGGDVNSAAELHHSLAADRV